MCGLMRLYYYKERRLADQNSAVILVSFSQVYSVVLDCECCWVNMKQVVYEVDL